eukprot:158410-Amphidinium_carterae.1
MTEVLSEDVPLNLLHGHQSGVETQTQSRCPSARRRQVNCQGVPRPCHSCPTQLCYMLAAGFALHASVAMPIHQMLPWFAIEASICFAGTHVRLALRVTSTPQYPGFTGRLPMSPDICAPRDLANYATHFCAAFSELEYCVLGCRVGSSMDGADPPSGVGLGLIRVKSANRDSYNCSRQLV